MNISKEKEMLEVFGCEDIKVDTLVNNYYINFNYKGKGYTIEHILNVYGAEVDLWELFSLEKNGETFKTLEELLEHIK